MPYRTISAVFFHFVQKNVLTDFSNYRQCLLQQKVDKIRRNTVETMSNIPWNQDNCKSLFMSFLWQKALQILIFFVPPPSFWKMLKKLQDWYRRASQTSLSILIFLGHSSGNIRYVQAGDTENSPRVWSTQWPDWATVSRDSGKHQLASIHIKYRPFWRKRYFEIVSLDFLNQSAKYIRMSLCSRLQNDPV